MLDSANANDFLQDTSVFHDFGSNSLDGMEEEPMSIM